MVLCLISGHEGLCVRRCGHCIQRHKYQPEEDVGISGGFTCARHRSVTATLLHFLTDGVATLPYSNISCPVLRGKRGGGLVLNICGSRRRDTTRGAGVAGSARHQHCDATTIRWPGIPCAATSSYLPTKRRPRHNCKTSCHLDQDQDLKILKLVSTFVIHYFVID